MRIKSIFITTGHIGHAIQRRLKLAKRKKMFHHLRSIECSRKQAMIYSRNEE